MGNQRKNAPGVLSRRTFMKTSVAAGVVFMAAPYANAATDTTEGNQLTASMIWVNSTPPALTNSTHAVFVREFTLSTLPTAAIINLFAYTRYRLYVNGVYIGRGPTRYQNLRPEYDARDISTALRSGENFIAVLVHRDGSSPSNPISRIQQHDPAFAAVVELTSNGATTTIATDTTWVSKIDASFAPGAGTWSSLPESVDGRNGFNYTSPTFLNSGFAASIAATGPSSGSPAFSQVWPRTIPLQAESLIAPSSATAQLPVTVSSGNSISFTLPYLIQGYHNLVITSATSGSQVVVGYADPYGSVISSNTYTCTAGAQTYMGGDTFSFRILVVAVNSGQVTFSQVQAVSVGYPFTQFASFTSNDTALNTLWTTCVRSNFLLSEDAYVDCADRERAEWIDCLKPAYDVTMVTMAGPPVAGSTTPTYGDARLVKALLRRIYLTVQPGGMFKAHDCSDRMDIHGIMEDRTCDWVAYLRKYYDATLDAAFVQECWPSLKALIAYFMNLLTTDGLVFAREWEVWDNPLRYEYCEGAGLNALVYRALNDAVYLGQAVGYTSDAATFSRNASALATAFNTVLWSSAAGSYYGANITSAGYYDPRALGTSLGVGPFSAGLYPPTVQAALFALQSGIVPAANQVAVANFIVNNLSGVTQPMSHFYLFDFWYTQHTDAHDADVLNRMRSVWAGQIQSAWGTSWEAFSPDGGSYCHVYGEGPGYFLTAYVLGARRVGSIANNAILIEPRCGGLTSVVGIAVTEFGPVPVSWTNNPSGAFALTCTVPAGVTATLSLYTRQNNAYLQVDQAIVSGQIASGLIKTALTSGSHTIQYPAVLAKYTVTAAAAVFTVPPGQSSTLQLTLTAQSGFTGTVTYTVTGQPAGISYTVTTGTAGPVITFTASATVVPGSYPVTITATSGYMSTVTTVTLVIGSGALVFVPMAPYRALDTRNANGAFGGPILAAGTSRSFALPAGNSAVPANAVAYSLNVTVVPSGAVRGLTMWATGQTAPTFPLLSSDGRIKAAAAIVPAGTSGAISVSTSDSTHVIVDVNGYFVPAATTTAGMQFYPVTPFRAYDTRATSTGGPSLAGAQTRNFAIGGVGSIPSSAKAFSLNVTVVPKASLGFLSVWAAGVAWPGVSTINDASGTVTANATVVIAGSAGAVSVFSTDPTDLILDVNGYFAPPALGGLSYYPLSPARLFSGSLGNGTTAVNLSKLIPASAKALVLNATVTPPSNFGHLCIWPDGVAQPATSTLNSTDGSAASNMAIVPVTDGSIDLFALSPTQLTLDLFGYFAP